MKTTASILFLILTVFFGTALALAEGAHEATVNLEKLGNVHFPTSCNRAVQPDFDRAMALLHSFAFKESGKAFATVAQADPRCAMAHWGTAVTLFGNPFTWPLTGQPLVDGWAAVEKAKAAQAKTPRERDYIAAVEVFYKDADKIDHRARAVAYEKAMEKIYLRYPQDTEAAVFYALALDVTALPTDKTYAQQLKAAEILKKIFEEQPNHPGVAHYLIHSHDYPPIAEQGLPAAKAYAGIAPSAPHALHMPSHIFTRRGYWQESIDTNIASRNSTENHFDQLHAMDYLMYAYLQTGQYREAQKVRDDILTLKKVNSESFPAAYALAAIPARYALERNQWAEAAKLKPYPDVKDYPWARFPHAEAVISFTRALGSARNGKTAAARSEIAHLQSLKEKLVQANNAYWADQTEIQIQAASAWLAHAEGKNSEALAHMRKAVELEAATEKHPVTPGPFIPTRELLGELLLALKQPAQALKEFETSQQADPNRFRGWYGAARAAESAGNKTKAREYYANFIKLCEKADGNQPELRKAKQYLAKK